MPKKRLWTEGLKAEVGIHPLSCVLSDMIAAVSTRSTHPKEAAEWLKYATQPGTYSLWLGRGLERANRGHWAQTALNSPCLAAGCHTPCVDQMPITGDSNFVVKVAHDTHMVGNDLNSLSDDRFFVAS
jgi:hypothetical protein